MHKTEFSVTDAACIQFHLTLWDCVETSDSISFLFREEKISLFFSYRIFKYIMAENSLDNIPKIVNSPHWCRAKFYWIYQQQYEEKKKHTRSFMVLFKRITNSPACLHSPTKIGTNKMEKEKRWNHVPQTYYGLILKCDSNEFNSIRICEWLVRIILCVIY